MFPPHKVGKNPLIFNEVSEWLVLLKKLLHVDQPYEKLLLLELQYMYLHGGRKILQPDRS